MASTAQLYLGCDVLQGLQDWQLDLSTAFLAIQEVITNWPRIMSYIGATGQLQEFQHVDGRVCVFTVASNFGCL